MMYYPTDWDRDVVRTVRGELDEFVLLCGYEDTKHVLHGIGMRKGTTGSIRIEVSRAEKTSFSEEDGLIISADVVDSHVVRVRPEILYIHAKSDS